MRLLSWNIQAGGGERLPLILNQIEQLQPDIVALSEVTYPNLAELQGNLRAQGLQHITTTCRPGGPNSVLLASRLPFRTSDETVTHDPERWLAGELDEHDLKILCVHVPSISDNKFGADGIGLKGERRKALFWNQVVDYAQRHKGERVILLGDFNSGLLEDAQSDSLTFGDQIRILRLEKYVDTWRHHNPNIREYTYYSKQGKKKHGTSKELNGFRLDYIFVSQALRDAIVTSTHRHTARTSGLSDHSIVVTDLSIGSAAERPKITDEPSQTTGRIQSPEPADYTDGLNELIRAYRKYLSISQRSMAEQLKMSERSYSDIETGRRSCPPGFLDSIRKVVSRYDSDVDKAIHAAREAAAARTPAAKTMTVNVGNEPDGGWEHSVLCRAAVKSGLILPIRNPKQQDHGPTRHRS